MCVRYSQFWCSVPSFIAHQPSDQNISAKRMPQPPQQREWETEPARVALNSQLTQSIKMKWLLIISNSSCFVVFLSVFFFFFSFLSIIFIKIEIYYYILIDFHYVMLLLLVALSARSRFVWDIWGVAVVEDALPCLVLSCLSVLWEYMAEWLLLLRLLRYKWVFRWFTKMMMHWYWWETTKTTTTLKMMMMINNHKSNQLSLLWFHITISAWRSFVLRCGEISEFVLAAGKLRRIFV